MILYNLILVHLSEGGYTDHSPLRCRMYYIRVSRIILYDIMPLSNRSTASYHRVATSASRSPVTAASESRWSFLTAIKATKPMMPTNATPALTSFRALATWACCRRALLPFPFLLPFGPFLTFGDFEPFELWSWSPFLPFPPVISWHAGSAVSPHHIPNPKPVLPLHCVSVGLPSG